MPSAANRKGVAFRSNHTVSVQLHTIPRLGYDLEHEHVFGSGKLLKDLMYCLPGFLSESAPVRHDWVCAKHQPDEQTIGHVLMFEVEPLLLTAAARRTLRQPAAVPQTGIVQGQWKILRAPAPVNLPEHPQRQN